MEKLVSSWSSNQHLPEDYVFPVEQRPGKESTIPVCKAIPVIDLGKASHGREDIIQQIIDGSQKFGFFQVSLYYILSRTNYLILYIIFRMLHYNDEKIHHVHGMI